VRPGRLFGFRLEPVDGAPCFLTGSLTLGGCGLPSTERLAGCFVAGNGKIQGGSSAERDQREALGRSRAPIARARWEPLRGGFSTKACVIADGAGRAIGFALAPGQAHELPMAPVLLSFLTALALWIVADRG